jgi:SAM-dependent methyltransferase
MKPKYRHNIADSFDASPAIIVPLLVDLFPVTSVIDVGCGIGNWMRKFEEHGVSDIMGIDGLHLNKSLFLLNQEKLLLLDLEKPFHLDRRFDMAICLEVAEHLTKHAASDFVKSLCSLSDLIVFSAAVPGQGGQNHINENWPSFWKQQFENNGFYFNDIIRPRIWKNESIQYWYKQNIFIASKQQLTIPVNEPVIDFIHPELMYKKLKEAMDGEFGVVVAAKTLLRSLKVSFKQRVKSISHK